MNREEIAEILKNTKNKYIILELITGYGKSKLAIDITNSVIKKQDSILLLVAKKVHKQTWLDEINKWGGIHCNNIIIECYESFKNYKNKTFDVIIADEMHHLSELRLDILESLTINKKFIGLSATIKKDMKNYFTEVHNSAIISCKLKEAVEDNILPNPTIYCLPLTLNNIFYTFKCMKFKKEIKCTQKGYYDNISEIIEWYKNKFMHTNNIGLKNIWLSNANKRLKWLAEQKNDILINIAKFFTNEKTLTFCATIEQASKINEYNITSHNKNATEYLNLFNKGEINHITAVNILNEGCNLIDCRIGVFGNINASEIMSRQKTGRILRHPKPIIIIPYFKDTREEEILQSKILPEYDTEKIHYIKTLKEIKL